MAKTKYYITSNCRIDDKHVEKGTVVELDPEDKKDMDRIALLNHAGRLGEFNAKNKAALETEIKSEQEREKRNERFFGGRALQPA